MPRDDADLVLAPEELGWAVEHALAIHSLAEADRARVRDANSLTMLRETLHECGLPPEDIAAALQSLPAAIAERRRRRQRRRRLVLAACAGATVLAAIVLGVALRPVPPPPPPLAFISLERSLAGSEPDHTWASSVTLNGPVEHAIMKAFREHGLAVVESVEPAVAVELYQDGRREPALDAVVDETAATVAVLGKVTCTNQGAIMDTPLLSLRADVVLRLVELQPRRLLGEVEQSGLAAHIDPQKGCGQAVGKAAEKVIAPLVALAWPTPSR